MSTSDINHSSHTDTPFNPFNTFLTPSTFPISSAAFPHAYGSSQVVIQEEESTRTDAAEGQDQHLAWSSRARMSNPDITPSSSSTSYFQRVQASTGSSVVGSNYAFTDPPTHHGNRQVVIQDQPEQTAEEEGTRAEGQDQHPTR